MNNPIASVLIQIDPRHVLRVAGGWFGLIFFLAASWAPSIRVHAELTDSAFARVLDAAVSYGMQSGGITKRGRLDVDNGAYTLDFESRVGGFTGRGYFRIAVPNEFQPPKTDLGWQALPRDADTGARVWLRTVKTRPPAGVKEVQASGQTREWVFTVKTDLPVSASPEQARMTILGHFANLLAATYYAHGLLPPASREVAFSGPKEPAIQEWKALWRDLTGEECTPDQWARPFELSPAGTSAPQSQAAERPQGLTLAGDNLYLSCATAAIPTRSTDGQILHSRREFIVLVVFPSERVAQESYAQMLDKRSWIWEMAPMREAFTQNPELRRMLADNLEDAMAGTLKRSETQQSWRASKMQSIPALRPNEETTEAGVVDLTIERYKTVVAITGGWSYAVTSPHPEDAPIAISQELATLPFASSLHAHALILVDRRVRFLRLALEDADPSTPLLDIPFEAPFMVRAKVEEWQREPGSSQWKWAPPPKDRPARVSLRVLPHAWKQPASPSTFDLLGAYRTFGTPVTQLVRLDGPIGGLRELTIASQRDRYYMTDGSGLGTINLVQGFDLTQPPSGALQVIDFRALGQLVLDSHLAKSPRPEGRNRIGHVGATLRAVACYVSQDGQAVDLAESQERQIVLSHVAEVKKIGCSKDPCASQLEIRDMQGNPLPLLEGLKLMPNDKITLGIDGSLELAYPFLGQTWRLRASNALEQGAHTDIIVYPLRTGHDELDAFLAESWETAKEWGPTIIGAGIGFGVDLATGGMATLTSAVIGAVVGAGVDAGFKVREKAYPEEKEWKLMKLPGP